MTHLTEGKRAPSFNLPSTLERKIALKDFKEDKNVVLYFYPKDDTPGCTQEAKDFKALFRRFSTKDTVILGVSPDSVARHLKFKEKYKLPFELLADESHAIAEKYGVWVEKNMYGRNYFGVQRATFLIDKQGKLAKVWPKVKVAGHCKDVLSEL